MRRSSLQSHSHCNISTVLSKLRGSLNRDNDLSTDRLTRKSNHRSFHQSLDQPSVLRNSCFLNRQHAAKQNRPSSFKNIFKSHSKSKRISEPSKLNSTSIRTKQILQSDFKQCLNKLDHKKHSHIGQSQCFLGYKCFVTVMSQMGYLNNWKNDSEKIDEIWKELGGQDYGGFLKSNLLLLLQIIEGVTNVMESRIKEFNMDQKKLRTEKNRKVFLKYQILRENRAHCKSKLHSLNSTSDVKHLNARESGNQNILNRLRKSLMSRGNQNQNKYTIKLRKKEAKTGRQQKLYETAKQQVRKQHFTAHKSFHVNLKLDVGQKLAKVGEKQKHKVNKQQDYGQIYDTQRNQTENIVTTNQYISPFSQDQNSHSPFERFSLPRTQRIALLSLDINLGEGKTDKIIVYDGDTPKQIAEAMAKRHSLNSEVTAKFEKILESHLNHILSKIEEVEEVTEELNPSLVNEE